MRGGGQCDDRHHEQHLRADPQHDVIGDLSVGVRPAMESLQGPQRLVREARVHELERVRQHGAQAAEQDRPQALRRAEQEERGEKAEQSVGTDRDRVVEERAVEPQRRADLGVDRGGPDRIVPVRDGIEREMAGEAEDEGCRGMRGQEARDGRADHGMSAQDHRQGPGGRPTLAAAV